MCIRDSFCSVVGGDDRVVVVDAVVVFGGGFDVDCWRVADVAVCGVDTVDVIYEVFAGTAVLLCCASVLLL